MVPHAADAGQCVLNQPQDLPVHHQLLRRGSVSHPQRSPFSAVVGEQEEECLGVTLPFDVLFQPGETRLDQRVLAGRMELHTAAEYHGNVLLVKLRQAGLGFFLQNLNDLRVTGQP